MRVTLKRLIVVSLVPILMVTFLLPQRFSLHASAQTKREVNAMLLENNIAEIKLKYDYYDAGSDVSAYAGYNMELEIKNKAGKPILVDLTALKINGRDISRGNGYANLFKNTGDYTYYSNSVVRVNTGATITRTATVWPQLFSYIRDTRMELLVGLFSITDLNKNALVPDSGDMGFSYEYATKTAIKNYDAQGGNDEYYNTLYYISGPSTVYRYDEAPTYTLQSGGSTLTSGVDWDSSDASVATIESGRLSVNGIGTTIITATYYEQQATMVVEVVDQMLSVSTSYVYAGMKNKIRYYLSPDLDEDDPDFELEIVGDSSIASVVDKCFLQCTGTGVVTVKGKYTTGTGDVIESAETDIKIVPIGNLRISSYSNNSNRIDLVLDGNDEDDEDEYNSGRHIYVYVGNQDVTDQVQFSIDNENVATVEKEEFDEDWGDGEIYHNCYLLVSGKTVGDTTLRVTLGNAIKVCPVYVYATEADVDNAAPDVQEVHKVPANMRGQKLYEGDDYVVSIKRTGYSTNGYMVEMQIENKTTDSVSCYFSIDSVNGLKMLNSNFYGYIINNVLITIPAGTARIAKITLSSSLLSLFGGDYPVKDIEGSISFSGNANYSTHRFSLDSQQGTTYERTRGGAVTIVNKDYVDIFVTSIVEYSSSNNALVNFYVVNKSDESISCDLFLESVNNVLVSENINFNGAYNMISPGKKMFGTFTVSKRTYAGTHRNISSMVIDVTVRDSDGLVKEDGDHTETVDTSGIPITMDYLQVSGTNVFYLNNGTSGQQFSVYESSYMGGTYQLSNTDVTWSSSDTDVIVVSSDGVVYPKGEGKALVRAQSSDNRWGVKTVEVVGDTLRFYGASDEYDYSQQLTYGCYSYLNYIISTDEPVDYSRVHVESENDHIIHVLDNRHVVACGEADYSNRVKVTVTYDRPGNLEDLEAVAYFSTVYGSDVTLNTNYMQLKDNETNNLYCRIAQYSGTPYEVEWEVENESIAQVEIVGANDGDYEDWEYGRPEGAMDVVKIVPKSPGTTKIYAYVWGYGEAECIIKVTASASSNDDHQPAPAPGPAPTPEKETQKEQEKQPEKPKAIGDTVTDTKSGASYTFTDDGGVEYTAVINTKATKVVIPDTVTIDGKTYPVTSVAAGAFKDNDKIKQVSIGKNVTVIEAEAFSGAKNLKTVNLASSNVRIIQSKAFKDCKKLKNLKVNGNTLKKVQKGAFKGAPKSMKVTVYAKNKKAFEKTVKQLKKGGLKEGQFKFKKRKK